eukprot:SAG31_NODE_3572_length_4115_cov_2.951693_2_plen_157_part_00
MVRVSESNLRFMFMSMSIESAGAPDPTAGRSTGRADASWDAPVRRIIVANEHQGASLRRAMAAASAQERASGIAAVAVAPPPGVHGSAVPVQLPLHRGASMVRSTPAWPYTAGLEPINHVGVKIPVVEHLEHWVRAQDLPQHFDVRSAYPSCSTMR